VARLALRFGLRAGHFENLIYGSEPKPGLMGLVLSEKWTEEILLRVGSSLFPVGLRLLQPGGLAEISRWCQP